MNSEQLQSLALLALAMVPVALLWRSVKAKAAAIASDTSQLGPEA